MSQEETTVNRSRHGSLSFLSPLPSSSAALWTISHPACICDNGVGTIIACSLYQNNARNLFSICKCVAVAENYPRFVCIQICPLSRSFLFSSVDFLLQINNLKCLDLIITHNSGDLHEWSGKMCYTLLISSVKKILKHVVWWRCKAQWAKMDDLMLCIALIKCVVLEVEDVFPHLWALAETCIFLLVSSHLLVTWETVTWSCWGIWSVYRPRCRYEPRTPMNPPKYLLARKWREESQGEMYISQSFTTAVSWYHQYSMSPLQRKWAFDKTLEKLVFTMFFFSGFEKA